MTNFIEYTGTERNIEDILVWWGGKLPGTHSEECTNPYQMHCCEGLPLPYWYGNIVLEATTAGPARSRGDYCRIPIAFIKNGERLDLEPGDRIYFREFASFYVIKKFDTPEFNEPEDRFHITDRGWCYSSSQWKMPEGFWEPWDLSGEMVKICGVDVKARGIEAFCSARGPSSPYRHSFAILVSDEDAERIENALRTPMDA